MADQWSSVSDVILVLQKRWDRGIYLKAFAAGEPWVAVVVPVRAPQNKDYKASFNAVLDWEAAFRKASVDRTCRERFSVDLRTLRGANLGANDVPCKVRVETFEQLCDLLGTHKAVAELQRLLALTEEELPGLTAWARTHPFRVLEFAQVWPQLLATVNWVVRCDPTWLYLRHIDVAGVDTKFVAEHEAILRELLTVVLPAERVDATETDFARRFGFLRRPRYTRVRFLDANSAVTPTGFPAGVSELQFRTEELACTPLDVTTVFVVENETCYLAFPTVPNSVVIFGGGYAVAAVTALPWLTDTEVVYWGDVDTHGFAILDQLRRAVPATTSILMDETTLRAHHSQYVTESAPTRDPLTHLNAAEREVYGGLIEDRYGSAVRLEQERIRFSALTAALEPWTARG
jgi:hypothetical protein